MTVTEDAPAAAPASSEPTAPAPTATGLASILGTGDHKVVGRIWLVASLLHLVLAGVAAIWVSVLRIDAEKLATDAPDFFAQAFTFRSIAGAFLFLLPWTIGVATLVVPLQVGASTIAFPRAAAAAAWTYLLGGGLVVAAYAIDGGALGDDTNGVRLFTLAFLLVLVALVVAWICIATTVIALRPMGMSLRRVPLFAWSALVAGTVWLVNLSVLAGIVVISYIDLRYGGATGFIPGGGAATLYAHIAWMFGQPALYAFAIPVLGFIASVVPVFSSTRHLRHRVAMGCIGAFGALAAGAWAMPAFGPDLTPWLYEAPWVAVSFLIVVPVLGLLALWALTLRQGTVRLASPLRVRRRLRPHAAGRSARRGPAGDRADQDARRRRGRLALRHHRHHVRRLLRRPGGHHRRLRRGRVLGAEDHRPAGLRGAGPRWSPCSCSSAPSSGASRTSSPACWASPAPPVSCPPTTPTRSRPSTRSPPSAGASSPSQVSPSWPCWRPPSAARTSPVTTRGRARPSSGPPARRPRSATSPASRRSSPRPRSTTLATSSRRRAA